MQFLNKIFDSVNRKQFLLLFLFPAFYLSTGAYFRTLLGDLSLRSIDPDYVYFSNGLGIAIGSFDTGNIFHPGSPLQYFVAIIFRLTYLLRSPGVPFLEDIFTHPDLYMSVVSFSITGVTALTLYSSGLFIFKLTKSILYGLLIQTTVFLPIIWYDLIGRVTPEVFLAFPALALILMVIKYYWENKTVESYNSILLFALIIAFGLSTKVTFLPLIIIPFLLIKGWKKKVLFLTTTVVLFLIISISVLFKIEVFWNWIKNIFLHSGDYGAGESNIIDFSSFKSNFLYFTHLEGWYFKIVVLSFIILLAYLSIFRKNGDKKLVIYSLSIFSTIVFQLIIVCKHFAHRNFIPSLLLLPLVVFFTIETIKKGKDKKLSLWFANFLLFAFLLLTVKNQFEWLPVKSNAMGTEIQARIQTRNYTSTLDENSIKIIVSQSYGSPFPEYAVMYSTAWTKMRLRDKYKNVLKDIYPKTYQFFTYDNYFKYWGEKFDTNKITDSGIKVYLYLDHKDDKLLEKTLDKLHEVSGTEFKVKSELLFHNTVTNEAIYQLDFTTS